MSFKVLTADQKDLPEIAKCHQQAFPGSFSSGLGNSFLKKNFLWYLQHPDAFLLLARNSENKVIGYAGGLLVHEHSTHGSSTSMMQFAFREAVLAIIIRPWLCLHPEMFPNYRLILKNIRLKLFPVSESLLKQTATQPSTRSLGLVVIGTNRASRGTGIGSSLLQAFEKKGLELNAERLHLSVKKSNVAAIKAYERNGWEISAEKGNNFEMHKWLNQ